MNVLFLLERTSSLLDNTFIFIFTENRQQIDMNLEMNIV